MADPPAPPASGLPSANPTESYWLKDPSPILDGHRTTDALPTEADVVIVGGGITGAFAGWFLKMGVDSGTGLEAEGQEDTDDYDKEQTKVDEKGFPKKSRKHHGSVVMLEAREVCSGATGRNGGHCQPLVYFSPSIAELELETYHFLDNLIKDHNIPCDWVKLSGVHAYLSQDIFYYAQWAVKELQETHPHLATQVTVVEPDNRPEFNYSAASVGNTEEEVGKSSIKETLSSLRIPHTRGAIIQQHVASMWPYKLIAWLLEQLLAKFPPKEFNLQTNTPVTSLRPYISRSENSEYKAKKWLLSTCRGDIIANKVILATNGYTSHLLPKMADLIVPVRGQMAALLPPPSTATAEISSPQRNPNSEETVLMDTQHNKVAELEHAYVFLASGSDKDEADKGYNTNDDHVIQRPILFTPVTDREGDREGNFKGGEFIFGGGRDFASSNYGVGIWQDDTIDKNVSIYLRSHLSPPLDLRPDPSPDNNDDSIDCFGTEENEKGADKSLLQATYQWTGIMGFTRDHHPLVGPVPASLLPGTDLEDSGIQQDADRVAGVWVCAGYNGHGMPVAPLSARGIVEQILGLQSVGLPEEFELTGERVNFCRASRPPILETD